MDLVGKEFNNWKIIGPKKKNGSAYFIKCICKCGIEKFVRIDYVTKGRSKSCGCFRKNFKELFFRHVEKSDGCWNWIGSLNQKGYGSFNNSKFLTKRTHRISWIIHFGKIPKGLFVCHSCDNPACVNPEHLFLGTAQDNTNDMFKKNREKPLKGEDCPRSKLTKEDVINIRNESNLKKVDLAKKYGVSKDHIDGIIRRDSWRHIP